MLNFMREFAKESYDRVHDRVEYVLSGKWSHDDYVGEGMFVKTFDWIVEGTWNKWLVYDPSVRKVTSVKPF
jgi:hypothetical protein